MCIGLQRPSAGFTPCDSHCAQRPLQRKGRRCRKIAVPSCAWPDPAARPLGTTTARPRMSTATTQPATEAAYPSVQLFIAGQWRDGGDRKTLAVHDPATGKPIGSVAVATRADL